MSTQQQQQQQASNKVNLKEVTTPHCHDNTLQSSSLFTTTNNNRNESSSSFATVQITDQQKDPTATTAWDDLIAGGVSGSAGVIVGHPFDTIKVRLQAGGLSSKSSSSWTSLFRGLGPPLATGTIINAIIFTAYGTSSRLWDQYYNNTPQGAANLLETSTTTTTSKDSWQKAFTCGCIVGAVQTLAISPIEHIKCRLQTTSQSTLKGPWSTMAMILRHSPTTTNMNPLRRALFSIRTLYRGFIVTCWREIPAFGLYFASYDYTKETIVQYMLQQGHDNDDDALSLSTFQDCLASTCAGGVAGWASWIAIYPFDVIKTKIQTLPLNTPDKDLRQWIIVRRLVASNGGIGVLFRGMGVTLLRAIPVNAIIFPVYEMTLSFLTKYKQRG